MTTEITVSTKPAPQDTLRITKDGIKFSINALKFQDKDSKQWIYYSPSLQVSSYGETEEKATEMMKDALVNFCYFMFELSPEERLEELKRLGWTKHRFKNKQFSKAYVDASGELKDFNADEESVQTLTLEAA